jgi:hypothetical protein
VRVRCALAAGVVVVVGLAGCGRPAAHPAAPPRVTAVDDPTPSPSPSLSPSAVATPSPVKPSPTHKPTTPLKKTVKPGGDRPAGGAPPPTADGVPTHGAGTFSVAGGGTDVVGTGTILVKYQVTAEDGIAWGANPVWTATSFAALVDQILAAPNGWTRSARSPVTDPTQHQNGASWSFQRVSGADYSVRIQLATPNTVDRLCAAVGLQTQGVYSCRYGKTILVNLRRWLRGATGFPIDLAGYRTMVVDHEMGHFLGFDHMRCPGTGQPAPVMQTQTIDLGGCTPNASPFAPDGTFVTGPWAPS